MAGNNSIDVKAQVQKAIGGAWAGFETRHPHLAAALDQQLLVEQATAALADDPEYRQAMAQAADLGVGAETVADLITRFVRDWLAKIL